MPALSFAEVSSGLSADDLAESEEWRKYSKRNLIVEGIDNKNNACGCGSDGIRENIRKTFRVCYNNALSHKTHVMRLTGDISQFTAPGQFVNISIPGKFLRRPISVCDYGYDTVGPALSGAVAEEGKLTLLYDTVGEGTEQMAGWQPGTEVELLVALGNGFDTSRSGDTPLLIGGGIGVAPLYGLAKSLKREGKSPVVVLGFNTAADVVMVKAFSEICPTYLATVDGTFPTDLLQQGGAAVRQNAVVTGKGFVTDIISQYALSECGYFYACGPTPMLKAVCSQLPGDGELSLEARMGCGFGACMCCSLETREGARRICKDGPVFRKEVLL